MEKIFKLSYELHDLIIKSNQYINLKEKEKIMSNDNNLTFKIEKLTKLQEKYINEKTENNLKALHDLKLEIDLNNNVIEYKKAYKELMILLDEITSTSFKDIVNDNILIDMVKNL